jgi:hypothetical protein
MDAVREQELAEQITLLQTNLIMEQAQCAKLVAEKEGQGAIIMRLRDILRYALLSGHHGGDCATFAYSTQCTCWQVLARAALDGKADADAV